MKGPEDFITAGQAAGIGISLFIVGLMVGGCSGGLLLEATSMERQRQQAIEANVGRWVIDEKTGDKQFVYGVEK